MNGAGVLVELAKALGLGKKDGAAVYGQGDLDWGWMVDPVGTARSNLNGAGRDNVVMALKDLLGVTGARAAGWYGIGGGDTAFLVVDPACDGIVWKEPEVQFDAALVRIGVGARVGSDPAISARCWLLGLGDDAGQEAGPHTFGSSALGPELSVLCLPSTAVLGLKALGVVAGSDGQKHLQLMDFANFVWPPVKADVAQLDPLALALFVLKTYVRWRASEGELWADDMTKHLFVAFGSRSDGGYAAPRTQKANPVPPFPGLFDAEWPDVPGGDLPQPAAISGANVGGWLLSLAPDADFNGIDADAAATFLLQLVWYITGKQPDLSTGSRIVSVEGAHVLRLSGQDVVTLGAWIDGAWIDVLRSSPAEGVEWLWGEATWQTGREGVSLSFSPGGLSLQLSMSVLGTVEVRYRTQEKRWEVARNDVGLADTLGGVLKEHLVLPFDPISGEPADWLSWILEQVPEFELTSGDGTSTLARSAEDEDEFTLTADMKSPAGPVWSAESAGLSLRSAQLTLTVPAFTFATPPAFPPAGTLNLKGLLLPFDASTGGAPLAAALLPDSGDAKAGIDLDLAWDGGFKNPRVQKGDKVILVQEKLGPVELDSIRVGLNSAEPRLDIDFELSLNLAGVRIQPEGLGVGLRLPVGDETLEDCLSPHLRGLGVAVEAAGISASGVFVEHLTTDGAIDYQGAAQLNFWGYHLDGVGAFSGADAKSASMFLFAGVSAPLGGTPEFFLTGLAGGFGYNRELNLPEISTIHEHPFLQVLEGESSLSTLTGQLSDGFPIAQGTSWFAAGLTFRTYGVIEGAGVLSVQLGAHLQVGLIGMAGLDLSPLAKLELALVTVVDLGDDPYLYVAIGLTSDSELLFGLIQPHGQGAYKQWFERGYAVLTIGGYDPDFSPPAPSVPSEAWPQADRIGFHAGWGPLSIDVDGYLAVLPREIQFGLRVEGSLDFGWVGLSAWIRAYSLVRWDPVYIDTRVSIGLSVWVDTAVWSDSWDLSLDMALWGPPFGGRFEIDLVVDTLVVEVGEDRKGAPIPSVEDVLAEQLGLVVEGNTVKAITDKTGRGAFHLDVLAGGVLSDAPKEQAPSTLRVGPEFALRLDSALPAHKCLWDEEEAAGGRGASSLEVVPSERSGLLSTLKVSLKPFLFSPTVGNADAVRATARAAPFPAALFGAEGLSPSKGGQTIRLDRGLRLDATLDPAVLESPTCRATLSTEVGEAVDLPLGAVADMEQVASGLRKAGAPLRRSWARAARTEEEEARAPWGVAVLSHLSVPPLPDPAPRGLPSTVHPRAPRRPAPAPGARRAALAGLRLERVQAPPVALPQPTPVDRRVLRRALGASSLEMALQTGGLRLNAGEALLLESTGTELIRGEGAQSLRLLCLGSDDRALEDEVLSPGSFQRALPTGTRRVLVQGLGTPDGRRTMAVGAGFTAETPLLRLGERGWAGPGVVICRRDELARPFQAVPALRAAELLHGSTKVELDFSAFSGALALLTRGGVAGVRATGATLSSNASLASADGRVDVYTVVSTRRWRLTVTLAPGVALLGVLTRPGDAGTLLGRLRAARPALEDPVASRVGWTDLKMERA